MCSQVTTHGDRKIYNAVSFRRTQQGFDRYRCRFSPNESSLKLIGDACSATVVLDLVYKNQTKNARYLGQKIVRNIPVKGWRLCKEDTAMDYWLVKPLFIFTHLLFFGQDLINRDLLLKRPENYLEPKGKF